MLSYGSDRATLTVDNGSPPAARDASPRSGLSDVGGGRGLAGMRERVQQAGGSAHAGPTGAGWRVELDVPA